MSGLGWYVTKHSYGLYGAAPPPGGFRRGDTSDAQREIDATALPVVDKPLADCEHATVDASTVVYKGDRVAGAPVVARLEDGRRVLATAAADKVDALRGVSLVGARIRVEGWPLTYRVEER